MGGGGVGGGFKWWLPNLMRESTKFQGSAVKHQNRLLTLPIFWTSYNKASLSVSPYYLRYYKICSVQIIYNCSVILRFVELISNKQTKSVILLQKNSMEHSTSVDINLLNTKRRPLYLKTQFVPRSKHFSSRL